MGNELGRAPIFKPSQFLKVETYGFESNGKKPTIREVLAEFHRDPGGAWHFKNSPNIAMGPNMRFLASEPVSAIPTLLEDLRAESARLTGHSVRKDAQLLLAGVISHPIPMDYMRSRDGARYWEAKEDWLVDSIQWLGKRWPGLHAVGEHVDEVYPHAHFYALAKIGPNGLSLGDMHPGQHAGQKAVKEAMATQGWRHGDPRLKFAYNQAFKSAMRELLDEYAEIAERHGLARMGEEQRERVSRQVHMARKKVASEIQTLRDERDEARQELLFVNSIISRHGIDLESERVGPRSDLKTNASDLGRTYPKLFPR